MTETARPSSPPLRPKGARLLDPQGGEHRVRLRYLGIEDGLHVWTPARGTPMFSDGWTFKVDEWPPYTEIALPVGGIDTTAHSNPLIERWPFLVRPMCWALGHDWDSNHRPDLRSLPRIRDWCRRCETIGGPTMRGRD